MAFFISSCALVGWLVILRGGFCRPVICPEHQLGTLAFWNSFLWTWDHKSEWESSAARDKQTFVVWVRGCWWFVGIRTMLYRAYACFDSGGWRQVFVTQLHTRTSVEWVTLKMKTNVKRSRELGSEDAWMSVAMPSHTMIGLEWARVITYTSSHAKAYAQVRV